MDVDVILKELREDLALMNEAILTIERLAAGGKRRRGRPPKWMQEVKTHLPKRRGRPPGSKNAPEGD